MDAWHLRGTPELGARDACLTAVTSFGRLTDTLTKCLTQGRTSTSLHRSPPLTRTSGRPTSRLRLLTFC
jgi:hypothetical protein